MQETGKINATNTTRMVIYESMEVHHTEQFIAERSDNYIFWKI